MIGQVNVPMNNLQDYNDRDQAYLQIYEQKIINANSVVGMIDLKMIYSVLETQEVKNTMPNQQPSSNSIL